MLFLGVEMKSELGKEIDMVSQKLDSLSRICSRISDEFNGKRTSNSPAKAPVDDRKTVLLKACRDMLVKCRDSQFIVYPMETTVFYDEADCDGYCLFEDIENELKAGE